jgi:DNA-binding CsgD family transcriptional regulator
MPAAALSRLLLGLHTAAAAAPLETAKETLLAALRAELPFDSAIWGSGAESPQLIFGIAALDFPLEQLIAYAPWQSHDALRAAAAARPGTALRNEDIAPLADHYASETYRAYCGPAGLEHTLGIAEIDPVTNVGELVFLFRTDRANPYSDAQRDLLEQAMPHLVVAWRHRLLREFNRTAPRNGASAETPGKGHAVIDPSGYIHASDATFGLAMRAAFPGWLGPLLPPPLRALATADGQHTVPGFRLIRGAERHILRAEPPGATPLSPAEHKVAALFAQGLTAPAVARRLNLSPLTVRNHVTAIYQKLDLHTKAELARYMARLEG